MLTHQTIEYGIRLRSGSRCEAEVYERGPVDEDHFPYHEYNQISLEEYKRIEGQLGVVKGFSQSAEETMKYYVHVEADMDQPSLADIVIHEPNVRVLE